MTQKTLLDQMITFFISAFRFPGLDWKLILIAVVLGLVFGTIWLLFYWPRLEKKWSLFWILVVSAFLTWTAVAFVQIPLQSWTGQALLHFWNQFTILKWLFLSGIPGILLSGFVQEGLVPFKFTDLELPGLVHIEPEVFNDERGFFLEVYKSSDFAQHGIVKPFVQVNHSRSPRGVVRGLHYQKPPMTQGKLVTVSAGEIFDVAVDLRKGSPTYGRAAGLTLDAHRHNMLWVPEGFAHGFCALSPTADIRYYCTEVYSHKDERGIAWNDPSLGIRWPIATPVLSKRDAAFGPLAAADNDFHYEQA